MTDLIEQNESKKVSAELVDPDPARSMYPHLYAGNKEQLAVCRDQMEIFYQQKLELAKRELADSESCLKQANDASIRINLAPFSRRCSRDRRRVEFFEKCLAAVQAGFMPFPEIPGLDIFAIRTTKLNPKHSVVHRTSHSSAERGEFQQVSDCPASGEGEYVDSLPHIDCGSAFKENASSNVEVRRWFPTEFDQVDFPMTVAHPGVMNQLDKAMQMKVFDEFGVSPSRWQRKGDPIVIGKIGHPNRTQNFWRPAVHFLICWYLDIRTL